MPSQPDNTKMEELLKAYAKKRQDAAGAPLELHPVSRRLLQEEVARSYRKAEAPAVVPWYRMVFQFWPRIAFAMGLVVLLGSTLWMLNRPPGGSQNLSLARNESGAPRDVSRAETDFDQPQPTASPTKAKELRRSLERLENAPLYEPPPAPTSRAMTAPAPVNKPSDSYSLGLADRKSPQNISEKETVYNDATAAGLARAKSYAANPTPAPAAQPSPAVPALEGADPNMAKAKSALNTGVSALSAGSKKSSKAGKDLSQGVDSLSATDETQKRAELEKRLYSKESLAKTGKSPESTVTRVPVAPASAPTAAGRVASGAQSLGLGYGIATTWTNMAYASAQTWAFQNGRDEFGRISRFGERPAGSAQRQLADKDTADQDSRLVGGFGNVGGDGRYGLLKSQAEPKAAKADSAASGPAPTGAAGTSAGATVELRGYVEAKPGGMGTQQNGAVSGFGFATNSVLPRYAQNSLAGGGAGGMGGEMAVSGGKVLDQFQLLQSDEVLRIVDSDGSVYEGKLLVEGEQEQKVQLSERGEIAGSRNRGEALNAATTERLNREPSAQSNAKDGALGERAQFKVSGINRTLGQLVVVTGRLDREPIRPSEEKSLGTIGQFGSAPQRLDNARGVALQPKLGREPVRRSTNMLVRISGTAVVGGTNQIILEAIPAAR